MGKDWVICCNYCDIVISQFNSVQWPIANCSINNADNRNEKKAWYIAIYFFSFSLYSICPSHLHIARDLMQVTGYAKVWFPFHLIRSCFICSAMLLMSISRPNWFWHCAYTRFVLGILRIHLSRIKYRIIYWRGIIEIFVIRFIL